MTAAIKIRKAEDKDRSALEVCFAELQAFELSIEPNRVEPDAVVCSRYIEQLLADCARTSGAILVAEVGGRVVGFVCVLGSVRSENIIEREPGYAYVTDVVVLESHRRSGVGSALLSAAEAHARLAGATRIRLGVLVGNGAAYRLYRVLGYSDNEIVLEKRLTPEPR